jgi:hypothetical protein
VSEGTVEKKHESTPARRGGGGGGGGCTWILAVQAYRRGSSRAAHAPLVVQLPPPNLWASGGGGEAGMGSGATLITNERHRSQFTLHCLFAANALMTGNLSAASSYVLDTDRA